MRPLSVIDSVFKGGDPGKACIDLTDARPLLERHLSTPTPGSGLLIPPHRVSVWGYRRSFLDRTQLAPYEKLGVSLSQIAFLIVKTEPGTVIVDTYFSSTEAPHDLGRIDAPLVMHGPQLNIEAVVKDDKALPAYRELVVQFLKPIVMAIYLLQAGVAELRTLPFKDTTRRERQLRRLTGVPAHYHYLRAVQKKNKTN